MNCNLILTGMAMLCCLQLPSQKLWNGKGGDDQWSNAANWVGNVVPSSTDDVLLDNSNISGGYTVSLPAGTAAYTVKTLRIAPLAANAIRFTIPSGNLAAPAFTATGPGYGILIENGGIFKNSSGMASGTSLIVTDSIRINNGGIYIHNTRTVHADNIVARLSKASGTENGTFEFDIPAGAGTLSLSNRTYGNLTLSAAAVTGGSRTYTASGSNTLTINGNLVINPGIMLSVDFASANGNVIIKGNLQNAGTLNLASGKGDNSIFKIAGNITQASTGLITETSTGLPSVELNGTHAQNVSIAGFITDSVTLILNNPSGATLLAPLSLAYKLILQNGQLTTSTAYPLTLQNGCTLIADSTSATSFVNGPMKRTGLSHTGYSLFPVGKNNMQRWLELKNATGNFTVEYIHADPHALSIASDPTIDHISGIEYWTIKADAVPVPSAGVMLSFDNVNSGGITNLPALLVTRLKGTRWTDLGNGGTTGIAAAKGSVIMNAAVTDFNTGTNDYFTLGTNISYANPLPLKDPVVAPRPAPQQEVLFTKLISFAPTVIQGNTATLLLIAHKDEAIQIVLTNQAGQVVSVQRFAVTKGSNKLTLNMQPLAAGMYQATGYTASGATNTVRCLIQ